MEIFLMDTDLYLSLRDAAREIPSRPHINTLRRWILRGSRGRKLEAKMIGGRWFTTRDAIKRFLENPRVSSYPTVFATESQRLATQQARQMGL